LPDFAAGLAAAARQPDQYNRILLTEGVTVRHDGRLTVVACGAVLVLTAALTAGASAASASAGRGLATQAAPAICTSATRPKLAARISRGVEHALAGRSSSVGLTASDPSLGLSCAFHRAWHFDSASAIKATIISALIYKKHGVSHLTSAQRALAWLMITQSDNDAATSLWFEVGLSSLKRFLAAAGMRHTVLDYDAWGLSQLTAQDELKLLQVLTTRGPVLNSASRGYILWLMTQVIPSQRWGVPAGAPSDVKVSVKNGWLPDPDTGLWHVNSIGAFRGTHIGYQIVILTSGNPSWDYGIDTIEAAARVINSEIAHA
jgi:hypothetical protein